MADEDQTLMERFGGFSRQPAVRQLRLAAAQQWMRPRLRPHSRRRERRPPSPPGWFVGLARGACLSLRFGRLA